MNFTDQQNYAIVQTELDEVFYQEFQYESMVPGIATAATADIFKVNNTTHAAYIEEVYSGIGLFDSIGETETVPNAQPKVANKMTTYVKDFAKGVELSKNFFDDNMHGVWSRTVSEMARKARITMDYTAFSIFRGAFTSTLTADGSYLCSTHTLQSGGTVVNNVTTTLSDTSLYTGIVAMRQQPDQAGVMMGNSTDILLVGSKLWKKAVQLTESALVADSANNAINVYRSALGIKVFTSPYLDAAAGGSDTAWFLLSRNHSVTRLIRQGLETSLRNWDLSNNRTYYYQANYREAYYVVDYVGVYGSTGTVAG